MEAKPLTAGSRMKVIIQAKARITKTSFSQLNKNQSFSRRYKAAIMESMMMSKRNALS
jgi:hypothetical protein